MKQVTVHVAGIVERGVQRCSRCGLALTTSTTSRVEQKPRPLIASRFAHYWGLGSMVATAGRGWWFRGDKPAEGDVLCVAVAQ